MDGVGGQRDGAGQDHDDDLRDGGRAQDQQADLDRADAVGAGFQLTVKTVGGVVRVRRENFFDRTPQSLRVLVLVIAHRALAFRARRSAVMPRTFGSPR